VNPHTYVRVNTHTYMYRDLFACGVATISRLLKIIGLLYRV